MDLSKRHMLKSSVGLMVLLTGGLSLYKLASFLTARGSLSGETLSLAGFQYHHGPGLWPSLRTGDPLTLVRETDNPHDTYAVKVLWNGHKLGYLPRTHNQPVARMMDHGDSLYASIHDLKDCHDPWQRVKIAVNKKA